LVLKTKLLHKVEMTEYLGTPLERGNRCVCIYICIYVYVYILSCAASGVIKEWQRGLTYVILLLVL